LVLEIGATQGASVSAIVRENGFGTPTVHKDLSGRDRVVVTRR
jgi:methylase of polypeptide subunit release factors